MDTSKFQTSFIPKKQALGGLPASKHSGGLFHLFGTIIFSVAILLSVGVFAYEAFLGSRISKMEIGLSAARVAIQPELIKELSRANTRFISAEEILNNHEKVSSFFTLLEDLTLQSIQFSSFDYSGTESNGVIVKMKGLASSYSSVALQSKVFSDDTRILSTQFYDLDLDEDGNVVFSVVLKVDPMVVSYKKTIEDEFQAMESLLMPQEPVEGSLPVNNEATTTEDLPLSEEVVGTNAQ